MKRETNYWAEFFNHHQEIIGSFTVSAYNPKQAMDRALDKFSQDLSLVRRVIIRGDDQSIKAEWNNKANLVPT